MSDSGRKQWLHSVGVCVNCKQTDAYTMAGRWYCAECAEIVRKRSAEYRAEHREEINQKQRDKTNQRISEGKCRRCGAEAYNGTVFCKKHLYKNREYTARCREKNEEYREGACLWCGSPRVQDKCFCETCLQRKREIIAPICKQQKKDHPWTIDTRAMLRGGGGK